MITALAIIVTLLFFIGTYYAGYVAGAVAMVQHILADADSASDDSQ